MKKATEGDDSGRWREIQKEFIAKRPSFRSECEILAQTLIYLLLEMIASLSFFATRREICA